ncbi:hypothetical protein [Planomonospora algeriensis]
MSSGPAPAVRGCSTALLQLSRHAAATAILWSALTTGHTPLAVLCWVLTVLYATGTILRSIDQALTNAEQHPRSAP